MTPLQSTVLFAEEYRKAFKRCMERDIDYQLAARSKGIDMARLLKDTRLLNQTWRARQLADEFGVKYQDYLSYSFDFSMRRQRRKLPFVNQAGPVGDSAEAWCSGFESYAADLQDAGLLTDFSDNGYTIAGWQGLPNQRSARERCLEYVRSANQLLHDQMRRFVYEREILCLEDFKLQMPHDVFEHAMEHVESALQSTITKAGSAGGAFGERYPSCFGFVEPSKIEERPCKACPLLEECCQLSAGVIEQIRASGGQTREERNRHNANARQRKSRAVRRAAHASGSIETT